MGKVWWTTFGICIGESRAPAIERSRPEGTYIPKPDGGFRPWGVAAVEDEILQRAVVEVLNGIYETDFLGFSYGFGPGRCAHDALDALALGIDRRRVSWVLDADIRGFFGQLGHEWLMKFLEHRIADRRVLRLIEKGWAAGVIEEGDLVTDWCGDGAGSIGIAAAGQRLPALRV